jgi:hypothetical protein
MLGDRLAGAPVAIHPQALRQRGQVAALYTGNHPGQSMPTPMLPSTKLSDEGLPTGAGPATGEVTDTMPHTGPIPNIPWNIVLVVAAAGLIVYSANLNA